MNSILNNRKAQITQPYVMVLVLVTASLFSILMFNFGADYAEDPNNKLDQESVQYIFDKSGFELSDNISATDSTDPFFTSPTDNEGNLKDFALEFQFYREQSSSLRNIFQDFWNLPVFFLDGLFLDREEWLVAINIWNTLIWVILLFNVYNFLRGLTRS